MNPGAQICHYKYKLTPASNSQEDEATVLQAFWADLKKLLGVLVVNCPGNIFSPKVVAEATTTFWVRQPGVGQIKMELTQFQTFNADHINQGVVGDAAVVLQHIVKRITDPFRYQKVGRRYYNTDAINAQSALHVFSGFVIALNRIADHPPSLQIDVMCRVLSKKNVIETIAANLDGLDVMAFQTDEEVAEEWRRSCVNATVVSQYNNRVYQVKALHFNMSPSSKFEMHIREERKVETLTYTEYYQAYYGKDIVEFNQPLLEAHPEHNGETVFLLPELCALTGFSEELRRDKTALTDALKLAKVAPGDRYAAICTAAVDVSRPSSAQGPDPTGCKLLEAWKLSLSKQPQEMEARVLEPMEVNFGPKKYAIEDGVFHRWMRNGLQCPGRIENWIFIYTEVDVSVVDIWLRSLRDIASVAFTMKMSDPKKLVCNNQRREIVALLEKHVTPRTQLVLLLTPQKDSRAVYKVFKEATCTKYPCISQVVKSETIRKRQSIAAVLSRIVLQINAKFAGPLWQVDLAVEVTKPLFTGPTMVLGIDVHRTIEGQRYMGFAASIDTACSEYFSTARLVDDASAPSVNINFNDLDQLDDREAWRATLASELQLAFKEALLQFSKRNEGLLPEHIVAYRASVSSQDWDFLLPMEVEALKEVLKTAGGSKEKEAPYNPHLAFVAISKNHTWRFFAPTAGQPSQCRNLEPGTVIDAPGCVNRESVNFFLVSHVAAKGTASPTHFTVVYDSAGLTPNTFQALSYRLSYMYYNFTGSVKMPAPAQYAKKIAHFVASAVRSAPHPRLLTSFFYL